MSGQLKVVGKPIPLRDAKEKVGGSAKYSADIQLEGMLHAKILGSPYPHAKIKKIDISRAEKIGGVVEILTYKNTAGLTYASVEHKPMCVLEQQVRYVGEPVAVVAAETEEIAEEALGAIKVEYEELPAVFDPVEGAKPDAPKLYPEGNIADPVAGEPLIIKWGDVDKAFREADVVVEGMFKTPVHPVTPIEPRACVASWDGKELSAWVSTQFPHRVKEDLANVLGLRFSQIRVISHFMGGGFGGKKQEEYPLMAALLSVRTNRPVKLEYSREEETIVGRRRYSSVENIKLAAKKDGTITAINFETYYDVGAHGNFVGGCLGLLPGAQEYVYKFENANFTVYDVNTNLPTAQPFRGVQFPAYLFGLEQLVDQVAEKVGMDPVEIRLKNTYRSGDITKPFGAELGKFAIEECVNKGIQSAGFREIWQGWGNPAKVEGNKGNKRRGIGLAYGMGWTEWMKEHSSATMKIYPDGTGELISGAQDIGTGCNTTLLQIAAEELGLPLEKIRLITGDTALTPNDWGACGSRTLYCAGTAAKEAAKKAKEALISAVCFKLNVPKADVEYKDGELYVKGKKTPISEVITAPVSGAHKNTATPTAAPLFTSYYAGGAVFHVAEVEVDIDTGEVRILKYTAVQDVGKAIDPLVVEGQMYGGCLQGLGYSLTEELLFDEKGKSLNSDFLDYKIFNSQDAPNIQLVIVESNEPTGPFGAMGVGEHCINPVAGAVANAVYNAIGVRLYEIPMTPERVLRALGKI